MAAQEAAEAAQDRLVEDVPTQDELAEDMPAQDELVVDMPALDELVEETVELPAVQPRVPLEILEEQPEGGAAPGAGAAYGDGAHRIIKNAARGGAALKGEACGVPGSAAHGASERGAPQGGGAPGDPGGAAQGGVAPGAGGGGGRDNGGSSGCSRGGQSAPCTRWRDGLQGSGHSGCPTVHKMS